MKREGVFRGLGTALVTPFRKGRIDYESLSKIIDIQIENGVRALIIGGTTGEAATLTPRERYNLYSYAKEQIKGRTKLIFGTGTNDTLTAVKHTKMAEEIGCDGVLVVTPYYNKGTEGGIEKHYLKIAESTNLPTILYNVPSRTGVNLGYNLLQRLSEHPRIVGLKEASDSTDRLVTLSCLTDKIALYAGNDSQIYPTLALGGEGVISVVSNLFPRESGVITESYFSGDIEKSLNMQKRMLPLIRALFLETNPSPVKYAMSLMGLCSAETRLPLSEPREETKEEIKKALALFTKSEE